MDRLRLRRRQTRRQPLERGATAVEAALVLPLFVFIVFALMEIGPLFQQWSSNKNAATEASRMSSAAGSETTADWDAVYELRQSLKNVAALDYVIVFRANSIRDAVPKACLDAAEAGRSITNKYQPVGVFEGTTPADTVETFDWAAGVSPKIACNVFYPRNLGLAKPNFIYDRVQATQATPVFSLNRYWPSQYRVDYMNGPQDYVGYYIQSAFQSPTGLLGKRILRTTMIHQIEPKRASR